MMPHRIVLLPELPRLVNGKVNKQRLPIPDVHEDRPTAQLLNSFMTDDTLHQIIKNVSRCIT